MSHAPEYIHSRAFLMYVQGNLQGNMANINGNGYYMLVVRSCSYIAMQNLEKKIWVAQVQYVCGLHSPKNLVIYTCFSVPPYQ